MFASFTTTFAFTLLASNYAHQLGNEPLLSIEEYRLNQ